MKALPYSRQFGGSIFIIQIAQRMKKKYLKVLVSQNFFVYLP